MVKLIEEGEKKRMALEALKLYKNTKSESKNLHHALVIESNVNIPKSHK